MCSCQMGKQTRQVAPFLEGSSVQRHKVWQTKLSCRYDCTPIRVRKGGTRMIQALADSTRFGMVSRRSYPQWDRNIPTGIGCTVLLQKGDTLRCMCRLGSRFQILSLYREGRRNLEGIHLLRNVQCRLGRNNPQDRGGKQHESSHLERRCTFQQGKALGRVHLVDSRNPPDTGSSLTFPPFQPRSGTQRDSPRMLVPC